MGTTQVVTLYFLAACAVIVPLVTGPLLAYGPLSRLAAGGFAARSRTAVEGLIAAFGRPGAALAVVLAWSAAVIAVFWPLGELAHSLENAVDWPVLSWVTTRRNPTFEDFNWLYTALGDRSPLKWVSAAGAIVFAVLWRRRFWIPLLAIGAQFPLEQYVQAIVTGMVDRGHPPTGLGSYPSGGIARIVMVFGTLALFAALTWRMSRRVHVALGTFVFLLAFYEGYSRIYVQKHWFTDVIAGILFGPALFLGFAVAVCVLAGRYPGAEPEPVRVAEPPAALPAAGLPAAAPLEPAQ
jgi:membrane-associated phospholipid phosphatase